MARALTKLATAALFMVACGSDPPEDRPDPKDCSASWKVVFSPDQEPGVWQPRVQILRWHQGRLYFSTILSARNGIRSVPESGGDPLLLYQGDSWNFWLEGSDLLYATGADLYRMPLAGGAAESIYHGHLFDDGRSKLVKDWNLDGDSIYWMQVQYDQADGWTLWRGLRNGGGDSPVAALPMVDFVDRVSVLPDQLVAVSSAPELWTVRKKDGATRRLPRWQAAPEVLGISDDGEILWSGYDGADEDGSHWRYSVARSRVDGSAPQRSWIGKPPHAHPIRAWADGAGGWYVSTWELGVDQAQHVSIFAIDAQGQGTRLACDPEVDSTVNVAAVGPQALYLVTTYSNHYSAIVAIPR
jgi:hypothetical protein